MHAWLLLISAPVLLAQQPYNKNAEHVEKLAKGAGQSAFGLDFANKLVGGTNEYWSDLTRAQAQFPYGFNASAEYSFYESASTPRTQSVTFGGGRDWSQASLFGSYSITPLANDYLANSVDVGAQVRTDSIDFRSTLGADVLVTHDTQFIRGQAPAPQLTSRLDITQRTATVSVGQRIYGTRLSADLGENSYNKDIPAVSFKLAQAARRFPAIENQVNNASGMLQGYPDWSAKFGVYQDVDNWAWPLTPWFTYETIHFLDSFEFGPPIAFATNRTADAYAGGLDVYAGDRLSGTVQYEHVRQTSQPEANYYGLSLFLLF